MALAQGSPGGPPGQNVPSAWQGVFQKSRLAHPAHPPSARKVRPSLRVSFFGGHNCPPKNSSCPPVVVLATSSASMPPTCCGHPRRISPPATRHPCGRPLAPLWGRPPCAPLLPGGLKNPPGFPPIRTPGHSLRRGNTHCLRKPVLRSLRRVAAARLSDTLHR